MVKEVYLKNGRTEYRAKWIDFGFAWPVNHLSTSFPGTTPYKSPELILAKKPFYCRASDVWALGAVLFRALNGNYPYGGEFSEKYVRV